jgi:acyl carrier protein
MEGDMDRAEIQQKVSTALAERFDKDPSELTDATRFAEDLDADSLELVEVVLDLEETFSVGIDESEMEDVKTIGEAVDLIVEKLGAEA